MAEVRLSDSVVTGNTNGFLPSNSGKIISYGNNVIDGNTGSNNPTQTVVLR